jgi:hypothetical protein
MNDAELEPIDIDDRSPGERMVAGTRAGLGRIGELVDEQRLDVVALIWVLCTITYTGVQIYGALNLFNGRFGAFGNWEKIAALASTGGPGVAVSCVVGIALAVTSETAMARFAIAVAGIVGAWVLVAGVLNVVYALHQRHGLNTISFSITEGSNRFVQAVGGVALGGFGLVVMMIAWRALGARPGEVAEIS